MSRSETPRPFDGPAPTYAERVRAALRVRCVHLKTKEAFIGLPSAHETDAASAGAIWWCDRTGRALGPDGRTADEPSCHGPCERTCYVAPRRPRP